MTVTILHLSFLCVHKTERIISNKHHFKLNYVGHKLLVLEYHDRLLRYQNTITYLDFSIYT
jgi:hypothetical protein